MFGSCEREIKKGGLEKELAARHRKDRKASLLGKSGRWALGSRSGNTKVRTADEKTRFQVKN